jgi:hypothetical protein
MSRPPPARRPRMDWPVLLTAVAAVMAGWFLPLTWGSTWMLDHGRATGVVLLWAGIGAALAARAARRGRAALRRESGTPP